MTTRLTRKKAIQICKELWTWLAETGKDKTEWPEWEKHSRMHSNCPLCEYVRREDNYRFGGSYCFTGCPYCEKFGRPCTRNNSPYTKWKRADSANERKETAKAFLAQLEQLE